MLNPNPCFYSYWQLLKVSCNSKSINKWRSYTGDNILEKLTKSPSQKVIPLTDFSKKSIPFTLFTIIDKFPKYCIYRSTNVGAILAATCYDKNLTKSPSQNRDPLTDVFLKINSIPAFTITDNFPKFRVHVYRSTNVGSIRRQYIMTHGRTDGSKQIHCVGYNHCIKVLDILHDIL
jgi:hypothetical protein